MCSQRHRHTDAHKYPPCLGGFTPLATIPYTELSAATSACLSCFCCCCCCWTGFAAADIADLACCKAAEGACGACCFGAEVADWPDLTILVSALLAPSMMMVLWGSTNLGFFLLGSAGGGLLGEARVEGVVVADCRTATYSPASSFKATGRLATLVAAATVTPTCGLCFTISGFWRLISGFCLEISGFCFFMSGLFVGVGLPVSTALSRSLGVGLTACTTSLPESAHHQHHRITKHALVYWSVHQHTAL